MYFIAPVSSAIRQVKRMLRGSPVVQNKQDQLAYENWIASYDTLSDEDRVAIRKHIAGFSKQPLISIVMPAYETPRRLLRAAIDSVRSQLYPNWELCVADDASSSPQVGQLLKQAAAADLRVKWVRREAGGNIAAATNAALTFATGEFVALLDHDDLLAEHALYEVAAELNAHPDADLIYTDEDIIDSAGRRHSPYFKPDWNLDLLLGHNMISHLGIYRRSLLDEIGGLREGFDGSQDYDLALRIVAATSSDRIRHIPAILYHWRQPSEIASFSQHHLDRCVAAARGAITDYLACHETLSTEPDILPAPSIPSWTRIRWSLPDPLPRVSIIVPTRDRADLLARCAAGLLLRTDYPDLELIVIDNDSSDPETLALFDRLRHDRRVRLLPFPGPFNYSAMNNAAVREATGTLLALLNNDVDVIEGSWLREMVSLALRPEVGAVGAKLLYPDNTVQHAGVVLGVGEFGIASHFGLRAERSNMGYFAQYGLVRELSAVTGACMVLRKDIYEAVGGLDADNLPVAFNDVDLCLRIRTQGKHIVWTPYAELYHVESASRGLDHLPHARHDERVERECRYMREKWGDLLDNDPFYNPNFSRKDHLFQLDAPPRRKKPWRLAEV